MRAAPRKRDAILATALMVATLVEAVAAQQRPINVAGSALAAAALGWVRLYPATVAAIVVVCAAFPDGTEVVLSLVPYLISFALVGRFSTLPRGAALVVAGGLVMGLTDIDATSSISQAVSNVAYFSLFSLILVGGGQLLQYGERREQQLATVAQTLDEGAAERERAAVEAERARIARELHDVVAHALTVVGVHAAVARNALTHNTDRAAASLIHIEEAAEYASEEMRRLVGLLRENSPEGPLPHLGRLPELVRQARDGGLSVDLTVDVPVPLPPGVDLTAYRVVQESLSNAQRHAPGSRVRVSVRADVSALFISVCNSAGDQSAAVDTRPLGSTGHGVIGMHERVALYGGRLKAEPTTDEGFHVAAQIPLT